MELTLHHTNNVTERTIITNPACRLPPEDELFCLCLFGCAFFLGSGELTGNRRRLCCSMFVIEIEVLTTNGNHYFRDLF